MTSSEVENLAREKAKEYFDEKFQEQIELEEMGEKFNENWLFYECKDYGKHVRLESKMLQSIYLLNDDEKSLVEFTMLEEYYIRCSNFYRKKRMCINYVIRFRKHCKRLGSAMSLSFR